MNGRAIAFLAVVAAVAVIATGWWLIPVRSQDAAPLASPAAPLPPPPAPRIPFPKPQRAPAPIGASETPEATEADEPVAATHVEEIKRELYDLDIDSVEQLSALDQLVDLGDVDTRDLWDTDWRGVDDWKTEDDGFRLDALDDGSFVFVPGEATRRSYTFLETMNLYEYDEETQEFVHQIDYYGKPITNIVKFLRKDVMVFLIVSGRKVNVSLYELAPD